MQSDTAHWRRSLIDKPRQEKLEALFADALEVEPRGRAKFLAEACAGDEALRREVEDLLAYDAAEHELLDSTLAGNPADAPLPRELGEYEVLSLLGRGGMGVVYHARHRVSGLEVALKVLQPALVASQPRSRFLREAEALRRLEHPGIAHFHEVGTLFTELGRQPYFAMEYVRGASLREFVATKRPPLEPRLILLASLCDAVQAAHEAGVVHRDLKPENIIVDGDGRPRIVDFGLARITDTELRLASFMTGVGQLIGTIDYMSPEQARAAPNAGYPPTDIYALGVVGYELLTGELPYPLPAGNVPESLVRISTWMPIPAGRKSPVLRGNIEAILAKAIEKAPEKRYTSAAAMAADIRVHLAGQRAAARGPFWALRGMRRTLARARFALITIGAALLAATLAVFWARASRVGPATVHSVCALVDEAEVMRRAGEADREKALAAIARYQEAQRITSRLTPDPSSAALRRFLNWRLGELHYFLGAFGHDRRYLDDALGYFRAARTIPWEPDRLTTLEPSSDTHNQVARLGAHHPCTGAVLALTALSAYETPVRHLQVAIETGKAALFIYSSAGNYADGMVSARDQLVDRAVILHQLGEAYVRLGVATDSLAYVEQGLSFFKDVQTEPLEAHWSVWGSYLHSCGAGWSRRAELAHDAAALDSAAKYLSLALPRRDPGREYWRTSVELARVSVVRAQFAARARPSLEDAITLLGNALPSVQSPQDDWERAKTWLDLAHVEGELARTGAGHALAAGDSLLDLAQGVFTRERFRLMRSEVEVERGRLRRIEWQCTGDETTRATARRALIGATVSVAPSEYPSLFRRAGEELAVLGESPALGARARRNAIECAK